MGPILERVNNTEREILREVRYGNYTIKNAPHIELSKPTPTGEYYIRDLIVDVNISKIYRYMKENNLNDVDYQKMNF